MHTWFAPRNKYTVRTNCATENIRYAIPKSSDGTSASPQLHECANFCTMISPVRKKAPDVN